MTESEKLDVTEPNEGLLDLDEPEEELAGSEGGHELDNTAPEWQGNDPLFIDVDGNIHVCGGRFFHSRVVGRVRGEDGAAAIGMLMDRFQALEDRFAALQREVAGSRNLVRNLKSMRSFERWVAGAKAIGDFESLLERAHAVIEKLEEEIGTSRTAKLALVERAEELAESTSWRSTAETMNELMEEWKRAGAAGGKEDDALWERFNGARRTFFERRSENFAERSERQKAKEELIARAEELAPSTDYQATFDAMQDLMEQWKQVGSAGRRLDDELWDRFRAARTPFFDRRKAYFEEQRKQQEQRRQERGPRRDRQDRGGPRGGPPRGGPPRGGAPSRTRTSGTLHASLAEIVGPLRDLFPDKNDRDSKDKQDRSKKR